MADSGVTNNVARAIMAALDWNSSSDTRNSAVSYLETVKGGDVRALAGTSFALVKRDWSIEVRLHALKMLQHLVRLRWDELSPTERWEFASVAIGLMSEIANPSEEWALKSQMAALVAEMVRREGLNLWQELRPSLISLSNSGPVQAELVAMMLRWLPEDITVHNEDLEGDRRRLLLSGLTQSLPEIFPLLYTLLERHFGAAVNEVGRQQLDIAKQHAASVTATLNAINAYAEWAPVPDLFKYGIIKGCGFLLSSPDFRLLACEFFQLVSPRKRPVDDSASEFDTAVSNNFQILMNVSGDFLLKSNTSSIDSSEYDFAECICKCMVSLGSSNLQCIYGDDTTVSNYLQQMMGYYQHKKLVLHYHALLFWLALMRDLTLKPKTVAHTSGDGSVNVVTTGSGQGSIEKRKILPFISDDVCSWLLEIAFQRVLKKEKVMIGSSFFGDLIELWSEDFEGNGDFGQYRSKLLELIRFVAYMKPLTATSKVSERLMTIIHSDSLAAVPALKLAVMESMVSVLDNIVSAVFDGYDLSGSSAETRLAIFRIFESLLQQLLSLKWTEPAHVEVLGHYMDAIGPFLKYFPDAVGSVVNKLFELLNTLPFAVKDPSTSIARHARLQICTSFIRIAKAADKSLLPHMKGIADTMAYMQKEGCLLRAEHNILGEAFLIMASAAGIQQQQEVLAWFLEPLNKEWTQLHWQDAYLSDWEGLVRLCSNTQFMWSLFHTVTFFEKALKRSGGLRKGTINSHNTSTQVDRDFHPLASHLSWMIPPLLKLLRALHSFWSAPVFQALPGEIKAALGMSDAERAVFLGESNVKFSKNALPFPDESQSSRINESHVQSNETDVRNWLKGIRDSGYNVLGLSMTVGDTFFKCFDVNVVSLALTENIQSMEFRHIRQLVHSVLIPLVKWCPLDMWEKWLEKLLHPLLLHSQKAFSFSWSSLLQEGRAKVPDLHGVAVGSDLKVEVIEEKLLRDLTREIYSLLSVIATPGLNPGLPSVEQSGHFIRVDSSSLKDLDTFAPNSMISFLLNHKALALPALQITVDAFKWTDGEAMAKLYSFCGAIVRICITTNNVELLQFVAKDLFYAIIQGLSLESNAVISGDLVGLCREIFMYLSERDSAPRQILLSLPCITPQDLLAFEEALAKTASPKEQKQHMRSLLMSATGNKLKALAAQKTVNVITNVSARPRSLVSAPESKFDEGDAIGLAAIL